MASDPEAANAFFWLQTQTSLPRLSIKESQVFRIRLDSAACSSASSTPSDDNIQLVPLTAINIVHASSETTV